MKFDGTQSAITNQSRKKNTKANSMNYLRKKIEMILDNVCLYEMSRKALFKCLKMSACHFFK